VETGCGREAHVRDGAQGPPHDGEWRNFSIRAVPVLQDGEIAEWVGVHIDITDRSRATEE
jgi:PAS domain S-box-containing protein